MEGACLPLKDNRGSTDFFVSCFIRECEWQVPPQIKEWCKDPSCLPGTATSKQQQQHDLVEEKGLGVAKSLLHHWNPQPSTMWNPRDPALWHHEFRVCHPVPRSLTLCWVTRRSTGSLGSYGPHFPHLSNAGKSIYHIKVVVKIKGSHPCLIC